MLLRPVENRNFPFSHIFCKGLPESRFLALLPTLDTLIFLHGMLTHKFPSKVGPSVTPVAHCITEKSFLLPSKTPRLQSLPISQYRTAASGSQPIPSSVHTSLTAPFMFYSHKSYRLGSQNIQTLHALPFRCTSPALSPSIITFNITTTASSPDGHLPCLLPALQRVR